MRWLVLVAVIGACGGADDFTRDELCAAHAAAWSQFDQRCPNARRPDPREAAYCAADDEAPAEMTEEALAECLDAWSRVPCSIGPLTCPLR